MAASSTPRKSTARKAPAMKAAVRTPQEKVADNIAMYDEFRQRAKNLRITRGTDRKIEPYVLGPEKGFDPPIHITFPTSLPDQIAFDQCARADDVFGMLGVLAGKRNLMRIAREFDQFDDGLVLMGGLVYKMLDHFQGAGAGDVPGGTPAS